MTDHPAQAALHQPGPALTQSNIWQVAWNHKLLMLLGILLGGGAAGAAFVYLPSVYQSTAQVLIVNKRPDTAGASESRPFAFDDYVAPHQELLKSQLIISEAIKKGHLQGLDAFVTRDPTDLEETIRKALGVTRIKGPEGKSNVLQMSFRCGVPDDCGAVLQAILSSYKDFLNEKYKAISDNSLELIVRETKELKEELGRKEAEYQAFREKSPLFGKSRDGLDLRQERLNSIQTKRSAMLLRRLELQSQLAAIDAGIKEGRSRDALLAMAAEFASKAEADDARKDKAHSIQEQLLPLLADEQKMLAQYGPKHPDVRAAQERVKAARTILLSPPVTWGKEGAPAGKDFLDLHIQILKQKLDQLQIAEKLLAELFETESNQARQMAGLEVRDESFRTSITISKQLYEALAKRLRDTNVSTGVGGCEVEVIGAPATGRKIFPSAVIFALGGVLAGCLLGLGLAYLAESRRQRLARPDTGRQLLGLPVVGWVPAAAATRNGSAGGLCTVQQPASREAEAYRSLRDALCFDSLSDGSRIIQITSPRKHEGKSLLAANLAVAIAQANKKVLLIDTDCQRPTAHLLFGLNGQAGLLSVLRGEAEPFDAIQESSIPHLDVLTCGPAASRPAECLNAPRLHELLAAVREKYDFVVVDTPAVLAVTEVTAFAQWVDGVLLTLRAGGPLQPARRAIEALTSKGAHILGVVLSSGGTASRLEALGHNGKLSHSNGSDLHRAAPSDPASLR